MGVRSLEDLEPGFNHLKVFLTEKMVQNFAVIYQYRGVCTVVFVVPKGNVLCDIGFYRDIKEKIHPLLNDLSQSIHNIEVSLKEGNHPHGFMHFYRPTLSMSSLSSKHINHGEMSIRTSEITEFLK